MLRLATDADLQGDIVRGLFRRVPDIDLVRVVGWVVPTVSAVGFTHAVHRGTRAGRYPTADVPRAAYRKARG